MATRSTTAPKKTTTKAAPKATATKAKAKVKAATTTTKTPAAKAVGASVAAPKATVVGAAKAVVAGAQVKKPELIERVMAETGMKKKDVKPVVEAMLAVLGRALSNGDELIVPPLGKVMVKRTKDVANARIMNVKVRHPTGEAHAPKDPLAQAAE